MSFKDNATSTEEEYLSYIHTTIVIPKEYDEIEDSLFQKLMSAKAVITYKEKFSNRFVPF